ATSTRGVRARLRRVAGCATSTGFAGHAGATANLKLTFHPDHSVGANHCLEPFRDFVPVLVARHGEERQQGCHRWIATTHNTVLLTRSVSLQLNLNICPGTIRLSPCGAACEHAPYDKHYDCTDDRSYESGTFASMIPADCLPQESGDECPGNAEKCRQDEARGLVGNPWMNPPRDEPRQE